MLDALGFKGIWNRFDWREIISALLAIKGEALADGASLAAGLRKIPFDLDVRFFSDTVFLAASIPEQIEGISPDESDIIRSEFALGMVSSMAQLCISRAMSVPIAYRGCIAVGDFEIAENFVIGPAVDAVAEGERRAEGAFVWFLPDALRCCQSAVPIHKRHGGTTIDAVSHLTTVYRVPLKESILETRVINPLARLDQLDRATLNVIVSKFLLSFNTQSPDVTRKRTNTECLLSHCLKISQQ